MYYMHYCYIVCLFHNMLTHDYYLYDTFVTFLFNAIGPSCSFRIYVYTSTTLQKKCDIHQQLWRREERHLVFSGGHTHAIKFRRITHQQKHITSKKVANVHDIVSTVSNIFFWMCNGFCFFVLILVLWFVIIMFLLNALPVTDPVCEYYIFLTCFQKERMLRVIIRFQLLRSSFDSRDASVMRP